MTGGDESNFVQAHRTLVLGIAKQVRHQYGIVGADEDLEAAGFRGLVEAQQRFDPERGAQLSTFAYYRVRGAILDEVRRMSYLPRRAHARIKAAQVSDGFAEDIADRRGPGHGRTQADAERNLKEYAALFASSFAAAAVGDKDASDDLSPEATVLKQERWSLLSQHVDQLPERERALIRGFYFEDREMQAIATELGVSKSWASRLHARALRLLRETFETAEAGHEDPASQDRNTSAAARDDNPA